MVNNEIKQANKNLAKDQAKSTATCSQSTKKRKTKHGPRMVPCTARRTWCSMSPGVGEHVHKWIMFAWIDRSIRTEWSSQGEYLYPFSRVAPLHNQQHFWLLASLHKTHTNRWPSFACISCVCPTALLWLIGVYQDYNKLVVVQHWPEQHYPRVLASQQNQKKIRAKLIIKAANTKIHTHEQQQFGNSESKTTRPRLTFQLDRRLGLESEWA